jgi:hypothetical protein
LVVVVVTYQRIRALLVPPNPLEGRVVSPAERAEIERADVVVRRGIRGVRWPLMGLIVVTGFISFQLRSKGMFALVLGSGITIALVWQAYGMRRWWRWALRQGANMDIVAEVAEDARLISPVDSWWGRRARRTWMKLPPVTDVP